MPYAILWGERRLQSVANLTRQDAREFLSITAEMSIKTHVEALPLSEANAALDRLRAGNVSGALVLIP
jgi:propanol-preferring alcohol dehydrogenase